MIGDISWITCDYKRKSIINKSMVEKHKPNGVEKEFINAFENLRHSLLEQLLESKDRDVTSWKPFWEIQALLHRLYNGEEEIISTKFNSEPAS